MRLLWVLLWCFVSPVALAAGVFAELDPARVGTVTAWLKEQPSGLGPPCADRKAWSQPALAQRLAELQTEAGRMLGIEFPAWNNEAYLEFSRTGQRLAGERMMMARKAWLYPLVVAECLEWKGRFLPAIERVLSETNRQPSWTWPAHDAKLANFRDRNFHVDLFAADMAHDMAQALYMLGQQLSPTVRAETLAQLEQRVFVPVEQSIEKGAGAHWWLKAEDNWNAVCLKGVVAAALAVLPDRRRRGVFAAAGEHYIKPYLNGFAEDGYAVEGPGYWNYGFSHFTEMREVLMQSTGGRIDLYAAPKVRAIALYGQGIEILPGNVPAFGDAPRQTRLDDFSRVYAKQALNLGGRPIQTLANLAISPRQFGNHAPLANAALVLFAQPQTGAALPAEANPLRTWFNKVGVLVSRPASGGRLGIAIKAGGNGNHSHNDIGSYVIALGAEQPTGDPGRTTYTAKTFSKQRYAIRSINSWGHPVPVVGGALQREATQVKLGQAAVVFTEAEDRFSLDLRPAYSSSELLALQRTMRHERAGNELVEVKDAFEFSTPKTFETALIAAAGWRQTAEGELELWQKHERLRARISASAAYDIEAVPVDEDGIQYTRIAIRLRGPQGAGYVAVRFTPL